MHTCTLKVIVLSKERIQVSQTWCKLVQENHQLEELVELNAMTRDIMLAHGNWRKRLAAVTDHSRHPRRNLPRSSSTEVPRVQTSDWIEVFQKLVLRT